MKILVFAFACDPSAGSEPNFGYNLAAGLAATGHEVWCITQSTGKAAIESELAVNPRPSLHFEYLDLEGKWKKYYKNQLGLYAFYITWQFRAAKLAKQLDAKYNIDILHHITWGSFQMGSGVALVGKPFVYGPCGGGQFALPMFKEYFTDGWRTEVFRKWVSDFLVTFNPLFRKTIKSKLGICLVANNETLELAKRLGAKRTLPYADPALPTSFWKENLPPRIPTEGQLNFIWTGRLSPRKGLKFTLRALALVDPSIPWRLTICGDGPQWEDLQLWIKDYNLQDRVTCKGSIPWAQMQAEYAKADAFILTSLRDSTGVQFLEAMAYGLPIFTLNMHGATIFVPEDAGYKIPITNPEHIARSFAEAVVHHYHHPECWQEMADAGRRQAFQYMWPQKIAFINDLYRKHLADVNTLYI